MARFDYDLVIIGSGFGGSVAALRAAEKGYRVGVMEAAASSATRTCPPLQTRTRRFQPGWQCLNRAIARRFFLNLPNRAAHGASKPLVGATTQRAFQRKIGSVDWSGKRESNPRRDESNHRMSSHSSIAPSFLRAASSSPRTPNRGGCCFGWVSFPAA